MTPENLHLATRYLNSLAAQVGIESYSVMGAYQNDLRQLADSDKNEDDLRKEIIALLILYALLAFQEGLDDSGAQKRITESDKVTIGVWASAQSDYVAGLAAAIVAVRLLAEAATIGHTMGTPIGQTPPHIPTPAEVDKAQSDVDARIALWAATLLAVRVMGEVQGGKRGGNVTMVTWKMNVIPRVDNCETEAGVMGCVELNGQRHPLEWFLDRGYFPRVPNSNTVCKGYRCGCGLIADDGRLVM